MSSPTSQIESEKIVQKSTSTVLESEELAPSLLRGATNYLKTPPIEKLAISSSPVHEEIIEILDKKLSETTTSQIESAEGEPIKISEPLIEDTTTQMSNIQEQELGEAEKEAVKSRIMLPQ